MTTNFTTKIRRNASLPELRGRVFTPLPLRAWGTVLQNPEEGVVVEKSTKLLIDTSPGPSKSPTISIKTTNGLEVPDRPRPSRRVSPGRPQVTLAGTNGAIETHIGTRQITFETRQPIAASVVGQDQKPSSDLISSGVDGHERSKEEETPRDSIRSGHARRLASATRLSHPLRLVLPEPSPREVERMNGIRSVPRHQLRENRVSTPPLPEPPLPNTTKSRSLEASLLWKTKALDAAKLDVFTTLTRSGDEKAPKTATLNIAATQRLVLAYQRRNISSRVARLYDYTGGDALDSDIASLRERIHDYCNAVRDLDFMQQRAVDCGENDEDDPFYLKSSKELDRLAMEWACLIPNHVLPAGPLPIARDRDHPMLPGLARTAAIKADKSKHLLLRFSMASAGGLFLIVPVLVMANIPGKTASLVTTCIAMLLFAVGVTFGTELKADQVLGATAAYAAVLVVFVGTSLADTTVVVAAADAAAKAG